MKQQRKLPGILIYLLILFFSVVGYVFALHASVTTGYQTVSTGDSNSKDGVEVSKTLEETGLENYFDITLKVKTKSKIDEIMKAQDIAVVVVIDVSYTMNDPWTDTDGSEVRKIVTAIDSARSFLKAFYDASLEAPTAAREIGFVSYNRHSYELSKLKECNDKEEYNEVYDAIGTLDPPNSDYDYRWTNMESGLLRAQDMLNKSDIKNKYIIFITDGLPTTYATSSDKFKGYNPYTYQTGQTTGMFYNHYNGNEIYGANYSDIAARKTEETALKIRNSGITIYSVGIGISDGWTIHSLFTRNKYTIDTETEEDNYNYYSTESSYKDKGARWFALTPGVTTKYSECTDDEKAAYYGEPEYYKRWMKEYVGSNKYYDSNNAEELKKAYTEIFADIKEMTEESSQATWVAEDPMGVDGTVESIEFVGFLDDTNTLQNSLNIKNENQSDTATITNNKINWDLKNSKYDTSLGEDNTTYYTYEVKYRVRIQNELDGFDLTKVYQTNGKTTLTYVIRNNGVLSDNKEIDFPIPSVVAYLGELEFTKKNATFDVIESGALANAEFTLTHASNCPCLVETMTNHKHMDREQSYTETSGTDGKVTFTNIPSGHKYVLTETKAPTDYDGIKDPYNISVDYGITTGGPANGIVENTIQTGKLKISKVVEGNKDYKGDFEFELTITYKNTTLVKGYNYTIYNSSKEKVSSGTIKLSDGKFKLKDGEYIVISGLPIGSQYTVKELTTNGYTVKHSINTDERTVGATATCSSTDCDINNGGTQTVNFYNIAGYILPATGSRGMLILVIIASLLLIVPIINIGYMFYKSRKEDKLTS